MRYYQQQNTGTLIITALNQRLLDEYGHDFLDSFPKDNLDLTVFSEEHLPIPHRALTRKDFYLKHKDRPVRSYKMDAVRFHWKPQAVSTALELDYISNYDSILWIDADTVFLKRIDQSWIDTHIRTQDIMSYMGRVNYYSETGLLFFNLRNPNTQQYIETVWNYYASERVFELQEWHDSYVWDYARVKHEHDYKWQFRNLGVDYKVPGGHIAVHLYGDVMDHRKGKRKKNAKSPENTVNNRRK